MATQTIYNIIGYVEIFLMFIMITNFLLGLMPKSLDEKHQ